MTVAVLAEPMEVPPVVTRRLPAHWTLHTVKVRPFQGEGANGPVWGTQVTHSPETGDGVYVEDAREVVVDASGTEVVSETRVHMSFEDAPPVQSLVTVWPGTAFEREAPVVKVSRFQHQRWPGYAVVHLR